MCCWILKGVILVQWYSHVIGLPADEIFLSYFGTVLVVFKLVFIKETVITASYDG